MSESLKEVVEKEAVVNKKVFGCFNYFHVRPTEKESLKSG